LFGVGGSGERLIGALARSLTDIVPDDMEETPRNTLGQRLATSFLQAGLGVLVEHSSVVVQDERLQVLV
jgi:hypothetical protein